MTSFDLIVVGLGVVGAACADAATEAGLRVVAIEPGGIGGGATAAAMGHLVAMDDDAAELALSRYSLALWDEFADLPQAQFSRCGTLWIARDERELGMIDAKITRLAAAGIAASRVDAAELARLEPAVVYPPAIAQFLVDRALARGATLMQGRRVGALRKGGVVLDDGTILHGPTLLTTGCALGELLPQLTLRARKGHLVITDRYPSIVRHQLLELGYAASAHGSDTASVAFNVQPRPTGQLLVGSSREFDSTSAAASMPMVRRMLARAVEFLPGLRGLQALRIWTGFRPTTADGRPYLGPVPERRDLWVAAGHEGLGVTTALGSARLLVDQLLGRIPRIDPAPYLPARVWR